MVIYPQNAQERRKYFLFVFAAINLIWIVNFGIIHTNALANDQVNFQWGRPLLNEITGAYSAFFLFPLLYLLWRHIPLGKEGLLKKLPIYITCTIIIGGCHTFLMYLFRDLLYPVFGFGEHDPGRLVYRYSMEFQKQVFWIWATWGLFALGRHIHQYHENRLRAFRLQKELSQSQLEIMRQQINPHFLFNSLNLISNKVYESAEDADRLITELSDLLRYSLEMGKTQTVRLEKELMFVEKYLDIMTERFGERIHYCINCDKSLQSLEVPSLILQPIVENSFKHKLEGTGGNLLISLEFIKSGSHLIITIKDKRSPSDTNNPITSSEMAGVGLLNIQKRLENLYQGKAGFSHGPINENQYEVKMNIPASTNL